MPSSFLGSTSAICEVGGRGSSRCGGVPTEGRRGVSRDRGTRWLEVALDLRGRRQRSDKLLYRSPPFGEVCADSRTCRFHMQFRRFRTASRNCCRVQIAPTARAGTHLFPLARYSFAQTSRLDKQLHIYECPPVGFARFVVTKSPHYCCLPWSYHRLHRQQRELVSTR